MRDKLEEDYQKHPAHEEKNVFVRLSVILRITLENDTDQPWLRDPEKLMRWIAIPEMLSNPLGIIHALERQIFLNQIEEDNGNIYYEWIGWSAISYISVLAMQNVSDGKTSMQETILEYTRSGTIMAVATT